MARVLVVSMGGRRSAAMSDLLRSGGHQVKSTSGFAAGLEAIAQYSPKLLIASARLENACGWDLVSGAQETLPRIHCILLDARYDPVIAAEAKSRQIGYLIEPVPDDVILQQVAIRLAEGNPRRWPRKKPLDTVRAEITNRPVRIIDVSYGGVQVELIQLADVPSRFDLTVPGADVTLRARPIWTRRGPYGWIWCGAELSEDNAEILARWKPFVDAIRQAEPRSSRFVLTVRPRQL
jgi:CheY-like chemotaxis protein